MTTGESISRHVPAPVRAALVVGLAITGGSCDPGPLGFEAGASPRGAQRLVKDLGEPVERDWSAITVSDTLTALMVNNSTSYFIYRGEAMGYEFRALRRFARDHDLVLEVEPVANRTTLLRRLNAGEGDVAAGRLRRSPVYAERVRLTRGLYITRPSLVQRVHAAEGTIYREPVDRLDLWAAPPGSDADSVPGAPPPAGLVQNPGQLAGLRIHAPLGSELVGALEEALGEGPNAPRVVESGDGRGAEGLIRDVARGEIGYAVAPENVAELKEEYYPNVTARPRLGTRSPTVWAVRNTSPELHRRLQRWIAENRDPEGYLMKLYVDYFVDREGYRERVRSEYLTSETGRLSAYDSLLWDAAKGLDWDWRLLASQAFQESRFDPEAVSWAGAVGMLQLMPGTARDMRVADPTDPVQNVEGAVRYLQWLERRWDDRVSDEAERLKFVLGSYNAGTGHVEDARRLAERYGDDPNRWADVASWLLRLSAPEYYNRPGVRFGFVRGTEPVTYVALILERYAHYRRFVDDVPVTISD